MKKLSEVQDKIENELVNALYGFKLNESQVISEFKVMMIKSGSGDTGGKYKLS